MPSVRTRIIAAVAASALIITIYACMERNAKADHCRVRNNAVVIQSTGAVVTPFAIPVAVPVQVVSPYAYQHAGARAQAVDPEYAEFLEWKKQRQAQVATQAVPQTLVAKNCLKCHTDNADAKASFDMSKPLDDKHKLAAIAAVMTGKMPKAKSLDPQVRADIVAELSGVEK